MSSDKLKSLADSLQLDHEACGNLNSMIIPCCGDLRELKGGHYHKIVEITEHAGECLLNEYVVRKRLKDPSIVCFSLDNIHWLLVSNFSCLNNFHTGRRTILFNTKKETLQFA